MFLSSEVSNWNKFIIIKWRFAEFFNYKNIYLYVYVYVCVCMCVCLCMCVCICVCVYV